MNTREIAVEYRLSHWAGIMRSRQESGLSIREYCRRESFHENAYYYWQRKLHEAACEQISQEQKREENTSLVSSKFREVQIVSNLPELPDKISSDAIRIEILGIKIAVDSTYPVEKLVELLRELNKP